MNKRQSKKASKKVIFPIIDEMNLLTLNEKEYKKAIEDFYNYVQKHFRYKHYKDKRKLIYKKCTYSYPIGEAAIKHYKKILNTTRSYNVKTQTLSQSLEDIIGKYEE